MPRALAIAWAYVAHADSSVSASMFEAIVEGYQSVEPLKIGELWALPSLLRFVLIENLRRLALRVNRTREMRNVANSLADRIVAAGDGEGQAALLARYAAHARDTTFATQLLHRLRDGSRNAGRALVWLETELESHGTNAEAMIIAEHQTLSSGNVTTGQHRSRAAADQRRRLDGVVREDQPGRRAVARAGAVSPISISIRATSTARRSRSWRAAPASPNTPSPSRRSRMAKEAADGRPRYVRHRLLPGRRTSRRARSGDRLPAAVRHPLQARLSQGRLGRHRRPGCRDRRDPAVHDRGRARQYRPVRTRRSPLMLVLLALPAMEAGLSLFNKLVLHLAEADAPGRLRVQGRRAGRGAHAGRRSLADRLARRRRREPAQPRSALPRQHDRRHPLRAAVRLARQRRSSSRPPTARCSTMRAARSSCSTSATRCPAASASICCTGAASTTRPKAAGWAGSASAASCTSSTFCCAATTTRRSCRPRPPLPADIVHVMTLDADTRMTRDAVTRLAGKLVASAQPAAHRPQRPAASCAATASCSRASPPR